MLMGQCTADFFYIVLGWCEMIKYDADSRGGPDHIGNGQMTELGKNYNS